MRGYFGIGAEGISKSMNLGNLQRSAHSFGASFFFTVDSNINQKKVRQSDTSGAFDHMPIYDWPNLNAMQLPKGCQLVGIELTEDSIELPSFHHPTAAAYILGPERGNLSDETIARCHSIVKIPMKFCVNVGIAGAIVMYDRLLQRGRFDKRPVSTQGKPEALPDHIHGAPTLRRKIPG